MRFPNFGVLQLPEIETLAFTRSRVLLLAKEFLNRSDGKAVPPNFHARRGRTRVAAEILFRHLGQLGAGCFFGSFWNRLQKQPAAREILVGAFPAFAGRSAAPRFSNCASCVWFSEFGSAPTAFWRLKIEPLAFQNFLAAYPSIPVPVPHPEPQKSGLARPASFPS